MVSNKYRFICCEFCDMMLCMGSSIFCSLFIFINEMKNAFYKHYSISLSVIEIKWRWCREDEVAAKLRELEISSWEMFLSSI